MPRPTTWTLGSLAVAVYSLCKITHSSVVGWHRTEEHNHAVGGHPDSWHLCGMAYDVVPDDSRDRSRVIALAQNLGLEAFDESDHVHIEPAGSPPVII